jgi:hypothetical protein
MDLLDGIMRVPPGPGFGTDLDAGWVERGRVITSGV